jgi:hypothetical protein
VKTLVAAVLLAASSVQHVPVLPDGTQALRVSCPVGHATRIVLPEALVRLRGPGRNARLELTVEHTRPQGVLVVIPRAYPLKATLSVKGATREFLIALESTPSGEDAEVRLELASVVPTAPATPPAPVLATPTDAPPPPATPEPAAQSTPSTGGLDSLELLHARVVVAGEREGLPGHPAMVLTDALQGERWVWLRFLLEGGAASRVSRVSWEGGELDSLTQEPQDKDLRIIVRLARPAITRRAHVTLEIEQGGTYVFSLGARSLRELLN